MVYKKCRKIIISHLGGGKASLGSALLRHPFCYPSSLGKVVGRSALQEGEQSVPGHLDGRGRRSHVVETQFWFVHDGSCAGVAAPVF